MVRTISSLDLFGGNGLTNTLLQKSESFSQVRKPVSQSPIPLPILPIHGPKERPSAPRVNGHNDHENLNRPVQPTQLPPAPPAHPRLTQVQAQLGKKKKPVPTSPSNFRTRAHASVWHGKQQDSSPAPGVFSEATRPYLTVKQRENLSHSTSAFLHIEPTILEEPVTVHYDFSLDEIKSIGAVVRQVLGAEPKERKDPQRDLGRQLVKLAKRQIPISTILKNVNIPRRSVEDVERYCHDVVALSRQKAAKKPFIPVTLTIQRDRYDQHGSFSRSSRISSLFFTREVIGTRGHHGAMRSRTNFANEFRRCRDDELELKEEWTNCAGDIATIAWVSDDSFICGTTEHSDAHNQQYNKPGNLVLGSCSRGTLRAYPQHRMVRPVVSKGENSTEAMRKSQDPWLYSSVVSSDFDASRDLTFTSGFDRTVKIWGVEEGDSGPSMKVRGEWRHDGNVNFVVSSKHPSGMVATAADVAANAIRIYKIRDDDITASPYHSFSCSRVTDESGNTVSTEKWAYFPATMQWGLSPEVQHLLLVGYSPRGRTGDDNDIPLDRKDSGELCLWDGTTGERWRVTSATTQNVFEVIWHPSQASFIAATSPLGLDTDEGVRTQIRIFRPSDNAEYGGKAFSPVKTLDCAALDINELTVKPNSYTYSYITAACTDGKCYVWDTSQGDKPIHVLRHGEPIDEYRGDREREDVGVKFTAWGLSLDRLYTGSSDGVIKVWNVRSQENPLVRDLLEVPAPISCGMFSPDHSKLVVGDASGRVFMLSVDSDPEDEEHTKKRFTTLRLPNGKTRVVRPPKPLIPHPEPPPPEYDANGQLMEHEDSTSVLQRARAYLENQQLVRHPKPHLGVVQGPRYAELGFYRKECYLEENPTNPKLAVWAKLQGDSNKIREPPSRRRQFMALKPVSESPLVGERHRNNMLIDLDVGKLPEVTKRHLEYGGVNLDEVETPDYVFDYEDDDW